MNSPPRRSEIYPTSRSGAVSYWTDARFSDRSRNLLVPEPGTAWRHLDAAMISPMGRQRTLKGLATRNPTVLFSFVGSLLLRLDAAGSDRFEEIAQTYLWGSLAPGVGA